MLLQRLRKSQSGTALYGDAIPATPEEMQPPSVYQTPQGAAFPHRLLVVANRLPVSAAKENDVWQLKAREHSSDTVSPHPSYAWLSCTLAFFSDRHT